MRRTAFEDRRKVLQLETLFDVGKAIHTLRPETELLEELVSRAMTILDAEAGAGFSLDADFQIDHVYGLGLVEDVGLGGVVDEPLVRQMIATRAPVTSRSSGFLGLAPSAFLAAPMIARDTVLGALILYGKESRGEGEALFSDDDARFLESLASIGAAAIDNTRSFHRVEILRESLEDENRALRQRMLREYSDRMMIAESPAMQRVMDLVARASASHANVLIRGESGTGKEMVARLLHANSPRADKPFVAINCAALPETLLESELFGIERGVATGVEARPGRFELANHGTVFLDEIGDIPLALQAKLLRVLQEREIEKLGGRRRIPVDVRILAATHRNLEVMVDTGEFRQDLYYRLKVVEITLPPLRERREDLPRLIRYFLDRYGRREGLENPRMSHDAMQKILRYPFPGNVRELENLIEGALAVTNDPLVEPEDLLLPGAEREGAEEGLSTDFPTLEVLERRYIRRVVEESGGNISQAARVLGIDRKTLYRKMKERPVQNETHVAN